MRTLHDCFVKHNWIKPLNETIADSLSTATDTEATKLNADETEETVRLRPWSYLETTQTRITAQRLQQSDKMQPRMHKVDKSVSNLF